MKKIISIVLVFIIIFSALDATVFSVCESALVKNTNEKIVTTDEIISDININDGFDLTLY